MKAKEKAIELYNKFWDAYQHDPVAHECALICVDEILEIQYSWSGIDGEHYLHWLQVKHEINKL